MSVILQFDNRENIEYIELSKQVNKLAAERMKIDYQYLHTKESSDTSLLKINKLKIIAEFLNESKNDFLILLDTDAWVNNTVSLQNLIRQMKDSNSEGSFSRDPYLKKNTFINSGSYIIKINSYTKNMFSELLDELDFFIKKPHLFYKGTADPYASPFKWDDQFFISNYVYANKTKFDVFVPHLLNTPFGLILRHNWRKMKNKKMKNDLIHILEQGFDTSELEISNFIDRECFPNKYKTGYDYNDSPNSLRKLQLRKVISKYAIGKVIDWY